MCRQGAGVLLDREKKACQCVAHCYVMPLYCSLLLLLLSVHRAVFASADVNGDGCLDQEELAQVLAQLGQPISTADVQAIME